MRKRSDNEKDAAAAAAKKRPQAEARSPASDDEAFAAALRRADAAIAEIPAGRATTRTAESPRLGRPCIGAAPLSAQYNIRLEAATAQKCKAIGADSLRPVLEAVAERGPRFIDAFAGFLERYDRGLDADGAAQRPADSGVEKRAADASPGRRWAGFDAIKFSTFMRPAARPDVRVDNVAMGVPCGFPSPALDYASEELSLSDLMIRNPSATFFCEAMGDSMIDAGIYEGDTLIIDRGLEPHSGDIVLAYVNGDFTLKRLRVSKGVPELWPENEAGGYPVIRPKADDEFHIEGVLRGICRRYKR